MLRNLLAHPLTRGMDPDAPQTTALRRDVIRSKVFLRQLLEEWYAAMVSFLPADGGPLLEIGSGGGFLGDFVPGLITSDLMLYAGISAVLDARHLPLRRAILRGILLNNVLHHIPRAREFFAEAARCVRPKGVMVMNEPWASDWSRIVYRWFHSEPFQPEASEWGIAPGGPLTTANSALPWMIFERDRSIFEREFPEWRVVSIRPHTPFRYLLSGGVTLRSLAPEWTMGIWRMAERRLERWMPNLAMFALIVLERNG